ncbi:MAG: hypothetical protein QM796_13790 [Chthoniobacteraceae bacterium]
MLDKIICISAPFFGADSALKRCHRYVKQNTCSSSSDHRTFYICNSKAMSEVVKPIFSMWYGGLQRGYGPAVVSGNDGVSDATDQLAKLARYVWAGSQGAISMQR